MKSVPINYIEFKAHNLARVKSFYSQAFGWTFTDYGKTYTAFAESGLEGGFEFTEDAITNGALIVLFHDDLKAVQKQILDAGGEITLEIFDFPGGQRFHFKDTEGNELAVWRTT